MPSSPQSCIDGTAAGVLIIGRDVPDRRGQSAISTGQKGKIGVRMAYRLKAGQAVTEGVTRVILGEGAPKSVGCSSQVGDGIEVR